MSIRVKILWLALLFAPLLVDASPALAAVHNAASCQLPDVAAAVNLASSGDIVAVPAGFCAWAVPIVLPANKDLAFVGAAVPGGGGGVTTITCNTLCVKIPTAVTTRVAGFSFVYNGTSDRSLIEVGRDDMPGAGKTFRLDHNSVTATTAWGFVAIYGGGPVVGKHPTGLIDHNTLNGVAVHVNGSLFLRTEGASQDALWAQDTTLGEGHDVVYIEDNVFNANRQNYVDGNYGARYVVRFNIMTGHATSMEVHSVQGNNRGVQRWEMYRNTISETGASGFPVAFIRAGTGVMFGNRISGDFSDDIVFDNVRSMGDPGVGACDGTSAWDQNSDPEKHGYACRDQIGRGRDTVQWTTGAAYTQVLKPAYLWDNTKGATPLSVLMDGACGSASCLPAPGYNAIHIVENRDWYRDAVPFNGSSGVGMGALASRPASCTTGVAYWATDQGEWNKLQNGPDGQLYKCTAANTWTLYYLPFTYPHPLQSAPPSAPKSLTVN